MSYCNNNCGITCGNASGRNSCRANNCTNVSCGNSCSSCSGVAGTSTYGCNSCSGTGNIGSCGCRPPYFPFPPQNSVCGTCPPGTRPCNCCHSPWWNGCGCGCGCGNGGNGGNNGYAFFNTSGATITSGSVIPLRYVIGSGELGRGTTGGVVSLDAGCYSVEYSLNAIAPIAGLTVTVTPEYLGALHPEYSRSFTSSAVDQSFDIAGSFVANLPGESSLSLVVTITGAPDGETVSLTDANASMLIRIL